MSYILLLDSRDETLQLQDVCLSRFYSGKIFTRKNAREAIQLIERQGNPELLMIDNGVLKKDEIYSYLLEKNLSVPLFIAADAQEHADVMQTYPAVTAVMDRPLNMDTLVSLVKSLTRLPARRPTHIPLLISTLLIFAQQKFDLFIKLSESNYVKVVNKGESFSETDAIRFYTKGITHLYLSYADSTVFLNDFEKSLSGVMQSGHSGSDLAVLTMESMETIEAMARKMGWSKEVIQCARKCINLALGIIAKDESLLKTLKKRLATPSSNYRRHIGLTAYLSCLMSVTAGQDTEAIQIKLALAALMHDLAVDEKIYEDVRIWNKKAADSREKSAETIKYLAHPFEATKILRGMETLPPDVDQIILLHHERPDGSGFPRGLTAGHIPYLPSLFIMVEELVDFIDNGENIETSLVDFLTWGRECYQAGHFRKIFELIEIKLKSL